MSSLRRPKTRDEILDRSIKETMLDLCGGQDTINQLRTTITQQAALNELDVSKQVDEALQEHPVDDWDDLITKEVGKTIATLYNENWPRETTLDTIKKKILGKPNN